MTYPEVLENARKNIRNCRACPECNGLGCGNTIPGPGSKGPGNGAHDNWKAWQAIRLRMDTFGPGGEADPSCTLFGRRLRLPLLTGPIGSLLQYHETDHTRAFNADVMRASSEAGILPCFGDGFSGSALEGALEDMARLGAGAIPVLNCMPNDFVLRQLERIEQTDAPAVCLVVDSAGLSHWKRLPPAQRVENKTAAQLRELRQATKKPFIVKGVLSARAAGQAVEAGADAVIVSNHGGRVLPYALPTAEALPEVVSAVGGQAGIIVDGGLRHGADLFKALALGADAVMVCRPFATAWFGGGCEGVKLYIEMLREELCETMDMCSARSLAEIRRDMLRF